MGEHVLLDTNIQDMLLQRLQQLDQADSRHCRVVVMGLPKYAAGECVIIR